jgi:hypothetical protein
MPTFFEPGAAAQFQARLHNLQPGQQPKWGKMSVAQMLSHCSISLEMAMGDRQLPRLMIGRLIGPIVRRLALGNERPLRPNSPTAPDMVIREQPEFAREQSRLSALVDRFAAGGPGGCTTYPHPFFGKLSPTQWEELMHKHLDHHLRRFGV